MDLDGAQLEGLRAAKFMISGCQTMYVNIAIYFPYNINFLWNTPKLFVCLVLFVIVQGMIFSFRIDKGSTQMLEHQIIYSPERKKNNGHITT
jgi:hypothetical protein